MKVLMIGLDGATFSLLKPLINEGVMPFLGSLIRDGAHGDLESTRNPLTPPAWTSMVTGRSPEAHGIYDFLRPAVLADGGMFLKVNDCRDNRCEAIASIVNRAGQRSTCLNFFGMSPPPEIDGYIISGFVPWKHLRHGTRPASLLDEVKTIKGIDYRNLGMDIGEEKKCIQGLTDGEYDGWIDLQDERDTAWAEVACHLMEKDRTELTAVVLDGPDKIQHLFWYFVDPAYSDQLSDERYRQVHDQCLAYYRKTDENIRKLVHTAGPDTEIILTSDHGFGPTTEVVYINEWLSRHGYLKWSDDAETDETGKLTADKMKDHLRMIDWKRTTAFCPTPSSNSIYIKKDIGTGFGVKEDDYLDFCLTLRQQLLDWRDPADGKQVFTGVGLNKLRGRNYVEPCPDLLLRLRDFGFVSILKSDAVVVQRARPDGTHRPNGIFIGYGPSFAKGKHVEGMNILDVAPTILTLLGVPVPRDFEGRVPNELFVVEHEVKTGEATHSAGNADEDRAEPSEEERQALMNQLKVLGYMD